METTPHETTLRLPSQRIEFIFVDWECAQLMNTSDGEALPEKARVPFTGFRYMKVWKLLWVFKRAFHWKKSSIDASYGFSLLYRHINFLKLRGLKRNSAQLRERCTIFNGRYTKGLPFLSKLVYAWVIVRGSSYTLSSVLRAANLQIIQCV